MEASFKMRDLHKCCTAKVGKTIEMTKFSNNKKLKTNSQVSDY